MVTALCQNCKQSFVTTDDDLALYARLKAPKQRYCADCRMQQLMNWRNERSLYKRKDMHGNDVISSYAPETKVNVLKDEDWWKDDWDALNYGKGYDFSRPFFEQFQELLQTSPVPNLFNQNSVNSEYTNHVESNKDSYLIFAAAWCENTMYSRPATSCKDTLDVLHGLKLELCYGDIDCEECFNLAYSQQCLKCNDSFFLYNCTNCSNCIGCVNLKNKSYYIFNQEYTKEEYEKKLKELNFGNRKKLEEFEKQFRDFVLKFPHEYAHLINTENFIGDFAANAKDCYRSFAIFEGAENLRYCIHSGWGAKDSSDNYGSWMGELMHKVVDCGIKTSRVMAGVVVRNALENQYVFYCHGNSNIFGCVGLRNKQYCILNKQYTREEYEALLPKVIQHMNEMPYVDAKGRKFIYGDFFPQEISPFAYNETIVQEYFPLTKEEAIAEGLRWKDSEKSSNTATLQGKDLPDEVGSVDDGILKQIIACEHDGRCKEQCTSVFKILPRELAFYRNQNIPLPTLCPNCRHHVRLAKKNPIKLWHRACACNHKTFKNASMHWHKDAPCTNEFETSYNPNRPEIVYCKDCFNTEVV